MASTPTAGEGAVREERNKRLHAPEWESSAKQPPLKRGRTGENGGVALQRTLRFEAMDRVVVLQDGDDVEAFAAAARAWMEKSHSELAAEADAAAHAPSAVASTADVMLHIASFCDTSTLCSLRAACRGLRKMMNSDDAKRAWEHAYVEMEKAMSSQQERSGRVLPRLRSVLLTTYAYIKPRAIWDEIKSGRQDLKCADGFLGAIRTRLNYLIALRRGADAAEVFLHAYELLKVLLSYTVVQRGKADMLHMEKIIMSLLRDVVLHPMINVSPLQRTNIAEDMADFFAGACMSGIAERAEVQTLGGGCLDVVSAIRYGWEPLHKLLAIRGWAAPIYDRVGGGAVVREGDAGYDEFCQLQSESPLLKLARGHVLRRACDIGDDSDPVAVCLAESLGVLQEDTLVKLEEWREEKSALEYRRYTEAFGTGFEELEARMRFHAEEKLTHGACLDLVLHETMAVGDTMLVDRDAVVQGVTTAPLSRLISKTARMMNGSHSELTVYSHGLDAEAVGCRLLLSAVDLAHWGAHDGRRDWCNGAADKLLEAYLSTETVARMRPGKEAEAAGVVAVTVNIGYADDELNPLSGDFHPGDRITVGDRFAVFLSSSPRRQCYFDGDASVSIIKGEAHRVRSFGKVCFSGEQISAVCELVQLYIASDGCGGSLACSLDECDFDHPLVQRLDGGSPAGGRIGVFEWFVLWTRLPPEERRRAWFPAVLWIATRACQDASKDDLNRLLSTLSAGKLPPPGSLKIAQWIWTAWNWPHRFVDFEPSHATVQELGALGGSGPHAIALDSIGHERSMWYRFLLSFCEPEEVQTIEMSMMSHGTVHGVIGDATPGLYVRHGHECVRLLVNNSPWANLENGPVAQIAYTHAATAVSALEYTDAGALPARLAGRLAVEVLALIRNVTWLPPGMGYWQSLGCNLFADGNGLLYRRVDTLWYMLRAHTIDNVDTSLASVRMRAFADLAFRAQHSLSVCHDMPDAAREIIEVAVAAIRNCTRDIANFYVSAQAGNSGQNMLPAAALNITAMCSIFLGHLKNVAWNEDHYGPLVDALIDALAIADELDESSWSLSGTRYYHEFWWNGYSWPGDNAGFRAFLESADREIYLGSEKNRTNVHVRTFKDAFGHGVTMENLAQGVDVWGGYIEVSVVGKGHKKRLKIRKKEGPDAVRHLKREVVDMVRALKTLKIGSQ